MPTSRLTYNQDLPVQRYFNTPLINLPPHNIASQLASTTMPSNQPPPTPASTQTAASNQGGDPGPW